MKEDLLQYIWQFQLFEKNNLETSEGEALNIINPGIRNDNAGPDFYNAQVKIGDLVWFGAVEIHINPKDWKTHNHHNDVNYENVILHVVWDGQAEVSHQDGTLVPMLKLHTLIAPTILQHYKRFFANSINNTLTCAPQLSHVSELVRLSVIQKSAMQRVERKANEILSLWHHKQKDWNQIAVHSLCKAFGFNVNADAFSILGSKISFKHIHKERYSFINLLSYLYLISSIQLSFKYTREAKTKLEYLNKKYKMHEFKMNGNEFRKSRLRPANFPEIRIAQFAALLKQEVNLLNFIIYEHEAKAIWEIFDQANHIIKKHYSLFNHASLLGKSSIESIIVNAIVPIRYAYGVYHNDEKFMENSINLLESIASEKNRVTQQFIKYGFRINSALESQGVLEHYKFYCTPKKCLNCGVGCAIMKNHNLLIT
ncbi:hypothetical protein OKW21_002459 [Catalinimonas alkaloidigena]|uniref:DUF2851 family protein n=1 Tax=Catalinimonas alkaloidigena TaxID=1075417 RepID=UPI0024062D80|nr:DUF2851 family protein [Catalinimonas alkaloidigena]MDF9797196.1 hypothetical protein [Catalinimonas alkaloidigena]